MVFSAILRKSASSLGPMVCRLARVERQHHGLLFAAVNSNNNLFYKSGQTPSLPSLGFSTTSKKSSSDVSLLRVIDSEIECAIESDDHDRVEETPNDFPFQIEDIAGLQTVTLTREYQGETIKVEVHMPDLVTGGEEGDDNDDEDDEKASQSSVPLMVTVSKKNKPSLEFSCTAYSDEISIDGLAVKDPETSEDQIAYEGPDFSDLDENLQKAFHKYLEIRGVKPSTINFLHEYMINKDSKEYLMWLKNLKQFVEA